MLHTFRSFVGGVRIFAAANRRLWIDAEHDDDFVLVDFDALYQTQNDPAFGFKVNRIQLFIDSGCKLFKPVDDEKQLALSRSVAP